MKATAMVMMIVRAITFVVSRIVDRTGQVVTTVVWSQMGLIAPQLRNVTKTKVIVIRMTIVKADWFVDKISIIAEKSGALRNPMIVASSQVLTIVLLHLHVRKDLDIANHTMIAKAIFFVEWKIVDRVGQVVTIVAWILLSTIAHQLPNVTKTKAIAIKMKIAKADWFVDKISIIAEKSGGLMNPMIVASSQVLTLVLPHLHVRKDLEIVSHTTIAKTIFFVE